MYGLWPLSFLSYFPGDLEDLLAESFLSLDLDLSLDLLLEDLLLEKGRLADFYCKSTGGGGFKKFAEIFCSAWPTGKFKVVVINEPGKERAVCSLSSG